MNGSMVSWSCNKMLLSLHTRTFHNSQLDEEVQKCNHSVKPVTPMQKERYFLAQKIVERLHYECRRSA